MIINFDTEKASIKAYHQRAISVPLALRFHSNATADWSSLWPELKFPFLAKFSHDTKKIMVPIEHEKDRKFSVQA